MVLSEADTVLFGVQQGATLKRRRKDGEKTEKIIREPV
jgi:hypothetical protein